MTRKRYRYDPESGEMIEIGADLPKRSASSTGALWNDRHYHGLRTTDGVDISSRRKHREYMRRTGLTTADDFQTDWARAKQSRERYMREGGSVRKNDIVEAIQQLSQRSR